MSYLQEKIDIETYFEGNWSHTPITFENGDGLQDSEWVRLSIQSGDSDQITMGDNPSFRNHGVVFIQIFTKKDIGSGRALALADTAVSLFRNLTLTNLRFKVPQVKRMPNNVEWFQVNVSTAFYRGS